MIGASTTRNPWFVLLVLAVAYAAGYVSADDKRIEAAGACTQKAGARP